jgi:hypothetical protein
VQLFYFIEVRLPLLPFYCSPIVLLSSSRSELTPTLTRQLQLAAHYNWAATGVLFKFLTPPK